MFPSRTGGVGHSDHLENLDYRRHWDRFHPERAESALPTKDGECLNIFGWVSIPNGRSRPFRRLPK